MNLSNLFFEDQYTKIFCCDCREIIGTFSEETFILTDPPWGAKFDTDSRRFSPPTDKLNSTTIHPHQNGREIKGDHETMDIGFLRRFDHLTLWGYQYFASQLPLGTILFWLKKKETNLGKFLSDGEIGFENRGRGVYMFPHLWSGFVRASEITGGGKGKVYGSGQKPIALFSWCIERRRLPREVLIVDPFAGYGASIIAARRRGIKSVAIEIDEGKCAIIKSRLPEGDQVEMLLT